MKNIFQILIAALSGGAIWEFFKLFYPDLRKFLNDWLAARNILNKYIDPLLKSTDELFGKLSSLANEDFISIYQKKGTEDEVLMNKIYLLYLFASFWGRLSIIKQESNYISLARTKKGKRLLKFMSSFEARKNRILDRSLQRAIGEALVITNSKGLAIISLYDFANEYLKEKSSLRKWITPLEESIENCKDKEFRQRFLVFGILLQAFIDQFDKHHAIVMDREVYLNKMNRRTKFELKYRIFEIFLPFVKNPEKYYHK
jgi:hypothetical protein